MFLNGNGNWCMLGFVSNHAFLCRTDSLCRKGDTPIGNIWEQILSAEECTWFTKLDRTDFQSVLYRRTNTIHRLITFAASCIFGILYILLFAAKYPIYVIIYSSYSIMQSGDWIAVTCTWWPVIDMRPNVVMTLLGASSVNILRRVCTCPTTLLC